MSDDATRKSTNVFVRALSVDRTAMLKEPTNWYLVGGPKRYLDDSDFSVDDVEKSIEKIRNYEFYGQGPNETNSKLNVLARKACMYMFVCRKFSEEESAEIRAALSVPFEESEVAFSKDGHLSIDDGYSFKYCNPKARNAKECRTFDAAPTTGDQFKTRYTTSHMCTGSKDMILSTEYRYILMYDHDDSEYRLLYNPIHSAAFAEWYSAEPDVDSWQGDRHSERLLQRYCKAFTIERNDGTSVFLDPTCNMSVDSRQCSLTAMSQEIWGIKSNQAEWPEVTSTHNRILKSAAEGNNDGGMQRCVCRGPISRLIASGAAGQHSFMRQRFHNRKDCRESGNLVICNVEFDAETVVMSDGSTVRNDCGQTAVEKAIQNADAGEDAEDEEARESGGMEFDEGDDVYDSPDGQSTELEEDANAYKDTVPSSSAEDANAYKDTVPSSSAEDAPTADGPAADVLTTSSGSTVAAIAAVIVLLLTVAIVIKFAFGGMRVRI